MRKLQFFIILLFVSGTFFAQSKYWYSGISHPANPQFSQPRILADTVYMTTYGWEGAMNLTSTTTIARSKDGLRDTFQTYYFQTDIARTTVFEYDSANRLLSVRERDQNALSFFLMEEFAYDAAGKLTQYIAWSIPGIYGKYDYSTIAYTDSSYIINQTEYVFDAEGRLIRDGKNTYHYFEDGYFECPYFNFQIGYHFLKNGYLSKRTVYKRQHEEDQWVETEKWELEYRYKSDNPNNTTANAVIDYPPLQVYGTKGAVMIQSDKTESVRIFSVSGILYKRVTVSAGKQAIALSKGFYIVVAGDKVHKVAVY